MSNFQQRDARQPAFWDERFEQQFTPWDKGAVPQQFRQFIAQSEAGSVLIPGCGNAYEAGFLAQQGWQVEAIDFSAAAVHSAQQVLGPWAKLVTQADFFEFTPAQPLALIYERAFFCALPPEFRPRIVQRWAELLPAGATLAGYFYLDENPLHSPKGPPFLTHADSLMQMMSPYFQLELDQASLDALEIFGGKERWQVWRRV